MNRWALAIILGYVAAFGVPKPPQPSVPVPSISTPSSTMRAAVEPVTAALRSATPADRALWADVWMKAAKVVEQEGEPPIIADMRVLREYVRIAAVVGWQRLGGNQPGKYAGLDAACDKAFTATLGLDTKALDAKGRQTFVELCEALAWAGLQR